MLILVFILLVFAYRLKVMVNRTNSQVKKNTLVKASNSFVPPENLFAKNNSIAFMVSNFYGEGNLDNPRFGKLNLVQ